MNLGERIADSRKRKKWTQTDLANQIFVTDKTISSWEQNRTSPGLETIIKLSELLECSIGYLLYGNIEKNEIETEIKVRLSKEEFQRITSFMKKNATFLNEGKQMDRYYQPTYRRFLKDDGKVDEWLRIGSRGSKKILNYKKWYDKFCDEYEVEIDDEKHLDRIFRILGLEEIVLVNKTRKTFFYANKYEIALDDVQNLGYFIEIEVKKYDTFAIEEYEKSLKVAKSLNLNLDHIDKVGYPYHFLYDSK